MTGSVNCALTPETERSNLPSVRRQRSSQEHDYVDFTIRHGAVVSHEFLDKAVYLEEHKVPHEILSQLTYTV